MPRFQFQPYQDNEGSIASLIMAPAQARARGLREAGAAQARASELRGQNWANAAGSIGNIISGEFQQRAQDKANAPARRLQELQIQGLEGQQAAATATAGRESQRNAALAQLLSGEDVPNPQQVLALYPDDPERGFKVAQGFVAIGELANKRVADARDNAGRFAMGAKAMPPELLGQFWPAIRQAAIAGGLGDAQTIPEQPTPQFLDGVIAWAKGEAPAQPEGFTLSPGQQRFGPDGTPIARIEEPQKPVTFGASKKWIVDGKETIAREGSDGNLYDMRGQLIEWTDLNIPEPKSGQAPPRTLTPNMESQVINRLAGQWSTATAPAREMDRQVGIMREGLKAAEAGDLAQGGQAVLVTFQKILDPTSVVRESEFDRSREGLSLKQRAEAAVERLVKGGPGVPLGELKKYAALAEQIAKAQRDSRLTAIQERLGKTADRYQIPRELVFETAGGGGGNTGGAADLVWDPVSQTFKRGGGGG